MPERIVSALPDMHSEAWWIRLMDGDLTAGERREWRVHLQQCGQCQHEWEMLTAAEEILRLTPSVPQLSPDFTAATVGRITQKQRLRRLLSFIVGGLIVALVGVLVFGYVGSAYASLERSVGVVISARQILFRSLIHTLVGLVLGWKAALPMIIGATLLLFLVMMPNGVLVTVALFWLSRHRRHAALA